MKRNTEHVTDQKALLHFDYQASTPCDPQVLDAMQPYWCEYWGNPSSPQSRAGLQASAAVSLAREELAACLKVNPQRLIFTSGATEANNLALLGHARARAVDLGKPGHLITVSTEHHSVIEPLRQLQCEGFRLTEITPAPDGRLSTRQLLDAFENDTFLVSVMMANNEIGVLQPLEDLAKLCSERGVIFHSDAAQAFGQLTFDIDQIGIDFLSISGHKIYGPKGIGALVVNKNVPILPLQWGGGQEFGIRSGTIPVPLVVGFAKAAEITFKDLKKYQVHFLGLRNELWKRLKSEMPNLILNGSLNERLFNNLNFTIPGIKGSYLHRALRPLIHCSNGSACSNGEPSHVLKALGRTKEESEASLRLSIGRYTTIDQVKRVVNLISSIVRKLKDEQ